MPTILLVLHLLNLRSLHPHLLLHLVILQLKVALSGTHPDLQRSQHPLSIVDDGLEAVRAWGAAQWKKVIRDNGARAKS